MSHSGLQTRVNRFGPSVLSIKTTCTMLSETDVEASLTSLEALSLSTTSEKGHGANASSNVAAQPLAPSITTQEGVLASENHASTTFPALTPPSLPPKPVRADDLVPSQDRGRGWLRIVGGYRRGVLKIVVEEFYRLGFRLAPTNVPDAEISVFWSRSFFPKLSALLPTQNVNWLPGMMEICRKDWLGAHLTRFQRKFGMESAAFWPESFNLPSEWALFQQAFRANPMPFILKPPLAARGEGICLYAKEGDAEENNSFITEKIPLAQRYIPNPLLFHGTYKMSFRFYVALTSIDPLRIYVYRHGLVRICSTPYVFDDFSNLLVHLTNYDLHVTNEQVFVDAMKDQSAECKLDGLRADWEELKQSLASKGLDVQRMWSDIQDLIAKSFIAAEMPLTKAIKTHVKTRGTAYEVTGFDVLLDDQLKPWLLEVNHTPSLCPHTDLENNIKRNMLRSLYQLVDVERNHVQATRRQSDMLKRLWEEEKRMCSVHYSDTVPFSAKPSSESENLAPSEISRSEPPMASGSAKNSIPSSESLPVAEESSIHRSPPSSKRSSVASTASSFHSTMCEFPVDENGLIQPDRFLNTDIWTIVETAEEVRSHAIVGGLEPKKKMRVIPALAKHLVDKASVCGLVSARSAQPRMGPTLPT